MSDRFHPISMEQLTNWAFDELEHKDSLFGIPRSAFFEPSTDDRYRIEKYGQLLETPFGVAAGPATQMAQNIVVSWLVGARFLELKTIQTLDELDVNKPCIDCQDEGYNVEWSQELKVYESFDEYLRAWVLIHALHHKLGFDGDAPGMIFNMSVGYNLEGIHKPNVQWFFDVMADASAHKQGYVDIVAKRYPEIASIEIPDRLSDSITLSTMHGCPPDEIEGICNYLLDERGLNTSVKLNPTLLGPDGVREIVNGDLGFTDVPIPDEAFGHDLWWKDAVPMLTRLWAKAKERELTFGVKLTNTLEVDNWRTVFPDDDMMYLSGRALHPVTTNLALKISEQFPGLLISFAGGADAFNVADLLRSGAKTITVCSDLLKSGGYMRLLQYFEELDAAMDAVAATSIDDFIARRAAGLEGAEGDTTALALANLRQYAAVVRTDPRYVKETYRTDRSKTTRSLGLFDCIEAPCQDACAVNQQVPQYMNAVRDGDFAKAVAITREDNPISAILGRVCDHLCETTCIRTHYDEPLAIREMKRFIMSHEAEPHMFPQADPIDTKVAVIGAGPAGIAAAEKLAYAGFGVTVFEMYPYSGGMVGGAIPVFRLPQAEIDQDMAVLDRLGVQVRYSTRAGVDFTLAGLRDDGFAYTVIAVGAQLPKLLGLEGEEAEGVIDGIAFLRTVREGGRPDIGNRVGVIGAGDTAMDCVRSAWRIGASDVSLIYRRTKDQMPADREEVHAATSEGVKIVELAKPTALHVENGKLAGLICTRNEYRGDRDDSGRKIPHEIPNSEFEVPLDTLILAISQYAILDFFGDETPELTDSGYIATDPDTFETSVSGVLAIGDVSAHGPQSIVLAAGDGKAMADALIAKVKGPQDVAPASNGHFDFHDLIKRRAHREYRTPVSFTPLDERDNFDETIITYTPEEAMAEASRCLDCHEICSLCVGVCPNMALMTYQMEPFRTQLPAVSISGGEVVVGDAAPWTADQTHQIAVLTDFCNECGNCTTFCPTSGDPYKDKPRLYLDREDFEAQSDNAFMMFDEGAVAAMEGRWGGETHRIELNGDLRYISPALTASIDPSNFSVSEASANGGGEPTLEPAASMYVLLKGLRESMPHIPTAVAPGAAAPAGMIGHPGYEE